MPAFASGFLLGFSLILAIGAQNAFVLRQGLRNAHVFWICLVCALSDLVLIAAGVAGFGVMAERVPWLGEVFLWGGVAFLAVYGLLALRAAWRGGQALDLAGETTQSLRAALLTCLAFTWANPHVYLDTLVLVGSVAATWGEARWRFGAGVATASAVFFFALGYGARLLAPVFARPGAWRVLDGVVGVTMLVLAAGLALGG
ncbi:MAG: LysE/ArgO family amino acid transporter [Paracoccaceae bacterium]|nr:LysE/ArgO family amino acid transporter [Paracoccaceae bacterium]